MGWNQQGVLGRGLLCFTNQVVAHLWPAKFLFLKLSSVNLGVFSQKGSVSISMGCNGTLRLITSASLSYILTLQSGLSRMCPSLFMPEKWDYLALLKPMNLRINPLRLISRRQDWEYSPWPGTVLLSGYLVCGLIALFIVVPSWFGRPSCIACWCASASCFVGVFSFFNGHVEEPFMCLACATFSLAGWCLICFAWCVLVCWVCFCFHCTFHGHSTLLLSMAKAALTARMSKVAKSTVTVTVFWQHPRLTSYLGFRIFFRPLESQAHQASSYWLPLLRLVRVLRQELFFWRCIFVSL